MRISWCVFPLILLAVGSPRPPLQAQAPVGASTLPEIAFAAFDSENGLTNRNLTEFHGKVIILYYFTPW